MNKLQNYSTRLLSSGEITIGMYIICFAWTEVIEVLNHFTGDIEYRNREVSNPWTKGIPYKVVSLAGPMIGVDTQGAQGGARIIFFDARLCRFIEVSKKYHDEYYRLMKQK